MSVCVCVGGYIVLRSQTPGGGGESDRFIQTGTNQSATFFITIVTHVIIKHCATIET